MKLSNILQACEAFSVDPAMKSSLACGTVERKEQVYGVWRRSGVMSMIWPRWVLLLRDGVLVVQHEIGLLRNM